MPNRIVREGILTSKKVNKLSYPAEVFYRRLMSVVDDFGRYTADLSILRAHLYPLKLEQISKADVSSYLAECAEAGLVSCYMRANEDYLQVLNFGQPRAKKSKWPDPPDYDPKCERPFKSANICMQMQADANKCSQTQTNVPYSNSYSYSNSEKELTSVSSKKVEPDGSPELTGEVSSNSGKNI